MTGKDFTDVADTFLNLGCDPQTTFIENVYVNYADPYAGEAVIEVLCQEQDKWVYGKNYPVEVQDVFSHDPTI